MLQFLNFFPNYISKIIEENINNDIQDLEEIRLRQNRPIILKFSNKETVIDYSINEEEILRILQIICDNSIYAYQKQICNGFITVKRWT